jgi:PleD family two-component response regulator
MSSPSTGTNSDASTAHPSDDPRKILIVDDDSDLTSMFKMVLEMNGFEVDAYNDPLLALYDLKPNSYGMALLDIIMPKMNGFELYKKMQDIDNNVKYVLLRHLKIAMMNSDSPSLNLMRQNVLSGNQKL